MSTIIDAKGKPCPTPVILAKQAMAAGEHSFTVLVDNTTAVENLKRLAGNQGFGAAVTQGEGVFSVAFTRTGCAACEEAVRGPLPAPGGRKCPGQWERQRSHFVYLLFPGRMV